MRWVVFLLLFGSLKLSGQTIYLIGDAGEPHFPTDSTLNYLQKISSEASEQDILLFLGDNLYPVGMPEKENSTRQLMEKKLNVSLEAMKAFPGRSFIIPGNHDWAKGKKKGWEQLRNMQEYVDEYLADATVFQPRSGCPGPVEIVVSPTITLVILDTQYLLHPWDKPGEEDDCDAKSSTEAILQLNDIVERNKNRHLIVAGHHPMYSYGPHGSRYSFRQHLFPLTDVNRNLWIPLPVIGSIYPVFRILFGNIQDIPHPRYTVIRNAIVETFEQAENVVYVNGHEHSLQYISLNDAHYITSGAGSKSSNVTAGKGTQFFNQSHGFARLDYETNAPVKLSFYDTDQKNIPFEKDIYEKEVIIESLSKSSYDFEDSTVFKPISTRYIDPGKIQKQWVGKNYRSLWGTPVEMSVFNIGREHGGLEIIKLGGGNQTKSLRLEAKDGRQYVLRSLDKFTDKLLPSELSHSLASDLLQDLISSSNPYGAFAVPGLAESAGIYHTNPKLMFIPDDPRFGNYRKIFAGLPVLYEERPNDEAAIESFFGSGEDVKGTPDLLEELYDDNDEEVDQSFALRSRLFDMLIGDWDRHDDQWRWVATDKEPKGHLWRPIPRDRDQAFYKGEGLIGKFASSKFLLPNTEGFDKKMDWAPGFNTSGRFFDRTFLNGLEWAEWLEEITFLQTELTNEAILSALQELPDTIAELSAKETSEILIARREDMPRYAREHYEFLAREVEVVGSNKHEDFLVERLDDEHLRVTVHKRKKDGELEQKIYQRTFLRDETKEVRLYGLGGEDFFHVEGKTYHSIKVRIVGGPDKDKVVDESRVSGWGKLTQVYDLKEETALESSKETKSRLSFNPEINRYNRTAFQYNKLFPLVSAQFNVDDGVFLGGGFIYTQHGWRKEPFAFQHKLNGNVALLTGALNLAYELTVSDVIGKWDINLQTKTQRPYGASNFFGLGNESKFDYRGTGIASGFDDEIDFYRIRYDFDRLFFNLSYQLGKKGVFRVGPEYFGFELEENLANKFIDSPASSINSNNFRNGFQYFGARMEMMVDTRNHPGVPTRGLYLGGTYSHYYGLNARAQDYSELSAEFGFLLSTKIPARVTLANRIGVEHNIGPIEFFNGAFLGKENLRGYRRARFVGNTSFYHNVDLRIRLFSFRTYLFPATVGLLGFHDIGRVWLDGENSTIWHPSKGFGIWLAPLNQFVLTFNMAFSDEEALPTVTLGYQF